jgi:hypothetical protein
MKILDQFNRWFPTPRLTRGRVVVALVIAIFADALQIALGPLGWTFVDEVVDVVVMILMVRLVGFHPLLLPTFAVEFLPIVDMLPTWTGCVIAVIALRKTGPSTPAATPSQSAQNSPPKTPPCIDI